MASGRQRTGRTDAQCGGGLAALGDQARRLAGQPVGRFAQVVAQGFRHLTQFVHVAAQGSHELVAIGIRADGSGRELSRLTLPVRPSCVVPV